MSKAGTAEGYYLIDHMDVLIKARDNGLTPELPDEASAARKWKKVPKDKYPYWVGLGVVYEHFHTSKTIRSGTTTRLVPEMYLEMHPEDAKELGIKDGEWVRVITRAANTKPGRRSVWTRRSSRPATRCPRGTCSVPGTSRSPTRPTRRRTSGWSTRQSPRLRSGQWPGRLQEARGPDRKTVSWAEPACWLSPGSAYGAAVMARAVCTWLRQAKRRGNPCGCPRLGRHEACPYWHRTYEMDI